MAGADCPTCGKNYDRPDQKFDKVTGAAIKYVFLCERCATVFDDRQETFTSLAHAADHYGYDGSEAWAQVDP